MSKRRWRRTECFVNEDLFMSVRQVILAADDVRDVHLDVVADDREIV